MFFAAKIFNHTFKDWAVLRAKPGFDLSKFLSAPHCEIYFKDMTLFKNFKFIAPGRYLQSGNGFRNDVNVWIQNSTLPNPWLEKVFDFTGSLSDFIQSLMFEGFEVTTYPDGVRARKDELGFQYYEHSNTFATHGAHVEFYIFKDTQWFDIENHETLWIPARTLIPLPDRKTVLISPGMVYQDGRLQTLDEEQMQKGFVVIADNVAIVWYGNERIELRGKDVLV